MASEGRLRIDTIAQAGDWSGLGGEESMARIGAAIERALPAAAGEVALALADDAAVRDLNARFRGLDKPTNVLSFPSGEPAGRDVPIGDVVIAVETLRAEAVADGIAAGDHLAHLTVHGILHLLGYDHETDAEAETMEGLETAILRDLGIADPYAERIPATNETD